MGTDFYHFNTEISPLGTLYAEAHFSLVGNRTYPINPEILAARYHGLEIRPFAGLSAFGVFAGVDATQSVLFIDQDTYMNDSTQHVSRQAIAHELGHIVYDSTAIRRNVPSTAKESYEAHRRMISQPGVETRANMFAGSFLVPRQELIKQSCDTLLLNFEDLQRQHGGMLVTDVLSVLAVKKLANKFDVSQRLLEWRLEGENIINLLGGPGIRIVDLKEETLRGLADAPVLQVSITERVKRLLPHDLLQMIEEGGVAM